MVRGLLVSDAALRAMDRDELRASFAHEIGHVRRRHRPLILGASLLAAVGRFLPGTQAAERELLFNLERDADEFAVRATNDPLALASAICKAAAGRAINYAAALQGRGGMATRLSYLPW